MYDVYLNDVYDVYLYDVYDVYLYDVYLLLDIPNTNTT